MNPKPLNLNIDGARFIKLLPRSKKPFEKEWQKNPYTYEEINAWNGNYGVATGYGEVIVVDADTEIASGYMLNHLPITFTVQTGKKGYHFYFLCKGIDKTVNLERNNVHYGEIRSHGSQVVGPGSIHPETGKPYTILRDHPIAKIDPSKLLESLQDFMPSPEDKLKNSQNENFHDEYQKLIDAYGQPYYRNKDGIISRLNESFWAGLMDSEESIIFEPDENCFYLYDPHTGLFNEISPDALKQRISQRILEVSREKDLPALERLRTNNGLNQIIAQLKGITEKREAFHKEQPFVHLANGVITFRSGRPEDMVAFSPVFCSRNRCPIAFDPEATCPRFLNDLLGNALCADDILLLQKYAGMTLLGENLMQRFLIIEGAPGSGKTTVVQIIQKLIGMANVSELRTAQLSERFELARYLKKTLLTGIEAPGNFLSQRGAHIIKGLVGGDCFDVERKNSNGSFPMIGNFAIIITSNTKLRLKIEQDHGAWKRRLLIVEFSPKSQAKKIPNFADILIAEEGSGILNWALAGLGMLLEDLKHEGGIVLPPSQEERIKTLLSESDSLHNFLSESICADSSQDVSVNELLEAYAKYCAERNWTPKPTRHFYKELDDLMLDLFKVTKSHSIRRGTAEVRGFRNVRLIRTENVDRAFEAVLA